MYEKQAKKIYLAIGSNLGNKKKNLEYAKYLLEKNKKIKILKTSNFYKTKSWPNNKHPFFINIVVEGITILKPIELFKFIKQIEVMLGRKKSLKNSPRECDIDIIDYDKKSLKIKNNDDFIIIPHPMLHKRNFVLLPLFELNKDWKHPVSKHNIKTLIFSLPNRDIRSIKQI